MVEVLLLGLEYVFALLKLYYTTKFADATRGIGRQVWNRLLTAGRAGEVRVAIN